MNRFLIVALCIPLTVHAQAYMCKRGTERIVSDRPCEQIGGQTTRNVIETNPPQPGNPERTVYEQLERIRENQKELDESYRRERPNTPPPVKPSFDKKQACENNWAAIEQINAQARISSTDYLADRKRKLQDERWKLGC